VSPADRIAELEAALAAARGQVKDLEWKLGTTTLKLSTTEMSVITAEAETVNEICAWMRAQPFLIEGEHTPHAQADAIERGDWKKDRT
jgi:hypothetical protein